MTTSGGYAGELRVVVSRCHDVTSDRGGASADPRTPAHDLAHPVEADTAWSESYYFNAYDPASDCGFFTRIGVRPNEGTMDVGLSVWLPGGELAEYRAHGGAARDGRHAARGRRRPLRAARGDASVALSGRRRRRARPCAPASDGDAPRSTSRSTSASTRVHPGRRAPTVQQTRRAAQRPGRGRRGRHHRQGPLRAGRPVDRLGSPSTATPTRGRRPTGTATDPGDRDAGADPRCGGGSASTSARRCTSAGSASARSPATCTGAGCPTDGRATSVAEWRLRTELADDGLTQRVVHLEVARQAGPLRSICAATCCAWRTSAKRAAPWSTRG